MINVCAALPQLYRAHAQLVHCKIERPLSIIVPKPCGRYAIELKPILAVYAYQPVTVIGNWEVEVERVVGARVDGETEGASEGAAVGGIL